MSVQGNLQSRKYGIDAPDVVRFFFDSTFVGSDGVSHIVAQGVYRTPTSSHVRIHNSDWHGYDYVAPAGVFNILHGDISNNNGFAARVTVLNGASSGLVESQFVPLVLNSVPYNVYGLIRMCTTEKIMLIVDRVLLYYKYEFQGSIDCIKVRFHFSLASRFSSYSCCFAKDVEDWPGCGKLKVFCLMF